MASEILILATRAIEYTGTAIILIGATVTAGQLLWNMARGKFDPGSFAQYRSTLGRSILLGLEFLVAADIINTVAIEPSLQSLAVLAGIVLIRTFLSFTLEVEIDGRWPWQQKSKKAG